MEATGRIVGRRAEIDVLRQLVREPAPARVVQLVGDPGIGKSRLLAELMGLAHADGRTVLQARAAEFERHVPFGVFVDALADHLAGLDPDRLNGLDPEQLALLGTVFPVPPRAGSAGPVHAERYLLHRAVRALLEALAGPDGLVLILDDLHWADEGSAELIDHLLRHPPQARLLLAVAYRPRQTPPRLWHALSRAADAGRAHLLDLAPLGPDEAHSLLPPGLPVRHRDEIVVAAGGNPFYLEALGRAGGARGRGAGLAVDSEVPVPVRAVLAAELAALDPTELLVAQAAAVAADEFDLVLLAGAAGLDDERVLLALDRLTEHDLVRPAPQPGRFRYRHPLVRGVAYQSAGAGTRLAAHARAADTLRTRGATATELAHHVERSAVPGDQEAVAVLTEAAAATMNTTPATAAHFLTGALGLLPAGAHDPAQRLYLLGMLARALGLTGDLRRSREVLHEVLRELPPDPTELRIQTVSFCALVESLLGARTEARALLRRELAGTADADPRTVALLTVTVAISDVMDSDVTRGPGWGRETVAVARAAGDDTLLAAALALSALGRHVDDTAAGRLDEAAALVDAMPDGTLVGFAAATIWLGWGEINHDRLEPAGRHLERGRRLIRATGQTHLVAYLSGALGLVHALTGQVGEATRCFEDSLDAAALTGSEEMRAGALTLGGMLALWRGDLNDALSMGTEAVAAIGHTNRWLVGVANAQLASALVHAGEPSAAIELLTSAGGGPSLPMLDHVMHTNWYQILAEAAVAADRQGEAVAWADRAVAAAAAIGRTGRTALALWARAIATMPADPQAAAPLALAAADHFERVGIVVDRGRALMLAGVAFGAGGPTDRARECFAAARTLFQGADAHLFLRQLVREERRMNARQQPAGPVAVASSAPAQRYGLTAREVETVALIGNGLTNREIGQRLHISPKTVEVHLSRIYAKLGVSGRAAVAAWWAGHRVGSGSQG